MLVPDLDGGALVRLYNAGERDVVARLVALAHPGEKSRERAKWLRAAASVDPERRDATALWRRACELARLPEVEWIDVATVDGALLASLLLDFGDAPAARTFRRALADTDPACLSAPPSRTRGAHDDHDEAVDADEPTRRGRFGEPEDAHV